MSADSWWRGAITVGVASAVSLAVAAFAPLLIRPTSSTVPASSLDLACLFLPTNSDWGAHVLSYFILALLLVSGARGIASFAGQMRRTQRTLGQLLVFARPLDPTLQALLQTLDLHGKIDLVQTKVPLAFCYGAMQPRICISTGMVAVLDTEELTALLWHERAHLLRRDPFKVAFGRAWIRMFFFLPLAYVFYRHYLLAKEVDADAYACAQLGSSGPLADALCALLDLQDLHPQAGPPTMTAGGLEELETRVDWLLGQPRPLTIPVGPILLSGIPLLGIIGLELALTHAGVASTLWQMSHTALAGC